MNVAVCSFIQWKAEIALGIEHHTSIYPLGRGVQVHGVPAINLSLSIRLLSANSGEHVAEYKHSVIKS